MRFLRLLRLGEVESVKIHSARGLKLRHYLAELTLDRNTPVGVGCWRSGDPVLRRGGSGATLIRNFPLGVPL
jgi:hypothetical protein